MSKNTAVLLLGSNLGDRKYNIDCAVKYILREHCEIIKSTDFLTTMPVEFASGEYFINFAALIRTSFSPIQLLQTVKKIERKMGRQEDSAASGTYTDRVIDIDIVYFNNINYLSEKLKIPHRQHLRRAFSIDLLNELRM